MPTFLDHSSPAAGEPTAPDTVSLILDAVTALLCAPLAILLAVGALLDLVERAEDVVRDARRWAAEAVDMLGGVGDVEAA